jgi:hypothetical protein
MGKCPSFKRIEILQYLEILKLRIFKARCFKTSDFV